MQATIVLTLIGNDRPGIVEALSETLNAHEANWEDSRMASLSGKFAGILQASVPASRADSLIKALDDLRRDGLHLHAERSDQEATEAGERVVLELLGQDHPGIVHDVSAALASLEANVEELSTSCEHASMAGGDLFRARVVLSLPKSVQSDRLRARCEAIANELMVDISLAEEV